MNGVGITMRATTTTTENIFCMKKNFLWRINLPKNSRWEMLLNTLLVLNHTRLPLPESVSGYRMGMVNMHGITMDAIARTENILLCMKQICLWRINLPPKRQLQRFTTSPYRPKRTGLQRTMMSPVNG